YSIYGKTVASACLNINYEFEGITITGVVGKPEIARSNRINQIFFVNKRYVRDRILSSGAEKAFKGMIPIGKFGFLVLNIEMDPSKVDVNVHPAKLEVRFEEEQKVFKAVYCGIQDTLLKAELIANSEVQIEGKNESIEGEEMGEEQETNSGLSGLFRKIAKNADEGNNLIESIYKSKNGGHDIEEEEYLNELGDKENLQAPKIDEKVNASNSFNESFEQNSITNSTEKFNNEEAMKNTINEFMQMGKNLTAEQIREKLSKIAAANTMTNETSDASMLQNKETNVQNPASEVSSSKEDIFSNFTLIPPKSQNTITSEVNPEVTPNNMISENKENYDTKIIDTAEIQEAINNKEEVETSTSETGQKPGDILLSILQQQSKNEVIPSIPPGQFDDMYAQIFGNKVTSLKEKEEENNANDIVSSNMSIFEEEESFKDEIPYKLIGIAFKTYIILEIQDELYILDQHAAHERIMYEKVKKNYYSGEDKDSQLMLLPDIITLTHKEMDIARENMDKFEKAGFVLEEFGENTIKLTGVPNICLDLDTKDLFLETLDEINTVARTAKQEIEERFIATIACKAAVKANMALTEEEVDSLLR
ncbi:MAG: hypothetical protein K2H53_01540, partial [Clostridia bacterium]|nr:hypothetical protein [Clostridia bacterium]